MGKTTILRNIFGISLAFLSCLAPNKCFAEVAEFTGNPSFEQTQSVADVFDNASDASESGEDYTNEVNATFSSALEDLYLTEMAEQEKDHPEEAYDLRYPGEPIKAEFFRNRHAFLIVSASLLKDQNTDDNLRAKMKILWDLHAAQDPAWSNAMNLFTDRFKNLNDDEKAAVYDCMKFIHQFSSDPILFKKHFSGVPNFHFIQKRLLESLEEYLGAHVNGSIIERYRTK